ncbi:hypothetical protein BDK51DRAFT_27850, partial [Blyttiomyces helicus]
MTPVASGNAEWNGQWKEYEMSFKLDLEVAQSFLDHLGDCGLACVKITGSEAPVARSEIVPMWFLRALTIALKPPKLLLVSLPTPLGGTSAVRSATSRERIGDNIAFGGYLQKFLAWSSMRSLVVLSGHLAHTHATLVKEPTFLAEPSAKIPASDVAPVFDAIIE